jgi:hypothetical protein
MADALSAMIDAASRAGHIKGVVSHLIQGGVTHLQYADTHSFASPLMEFRRIVVVALLLLKTLALVSVVYMLLEHLLLQCNNAWRNSTTLSCYTVLYVSTQPAFDEATDYGLPAHRTMTLLKSISFTLRKKGSLRLSELGKQ